MFITTISQYILNGMLLWAITGRQKSNLNCAFKLEPITIYHL